MDQYQILQKSFSQYFILLYKQDLEEYNKEELSSLLLRLQGNLEINSQQNQIYSKLQKKSSQNMKNRKNKKKKKVQQVVIIKEDHGEKKKMEDLQFRIQESFKIEQSRFQESMMIEESFIGSQIKKESDDIIIEQVQGKILDGNFYIKLPVQIPKNNLTQLSSRYPHQTPKQLYKKLIHPFNNLFLKHKLFKQTIEHTSVQYHKKMKQDQIIYQSKEQFLNVILETIK